MVSVVFALLTAVCNGLASVLQRIAAATAPPERALRLSLFGYLIRRKIVAVLAIALSCVELSRSLSLMHWPQPAVAAPRAAR